MLWLKAWGRELSSFSCLLSTSISVSYHSWAQERWPFFFPPFSSCLHLYCSKTLYSRPSSLPRDMLKREIKIKKIKHIFIFFPFPLSPLPSSLLPSLPLPRPLSFSISLLIKDLTFLCIILSSPTQKGKLQGLD